MKILLLRCTLALIMCGASASAWADDDVIINESFSNFVINQDWTNNQAKNVNGWSIFNCSIQDYVAGKTVKILKIDKKGDSPNIRYGYAISPKLGYAGDLILTFNYGNTATNKTTRLKLSIENGGTFEDQTQTCTITSTELFSDGPSSAIYKIIGVTSNTQIKFELLSTYIFAIDDVVVTKDGMTLSEAGNNKDFITAHPDTTMTVKTSRTLKHGIWNTMCLPFEVTTSQMQQALGTADFQMRTYTGYAGGMMTFTTASTIPAGTPFLVKPNTEEDIANPTFESVTINATADTVVNHDGVKFIGTYSGRDLNIDGTHLFITTDGTVAKPGDDTQNHLKGLRAYIEVPSGTTTPSRLNIDDETVDIQQIDADDDYSTALYDLKGLRLERPKKGLCIKDGKLIFIK